MPTNVRRTGLSFLLAAFAGMSVPPTTAQVPIIAPRLSLVHPAADDQDDLCVWVHPTDPALSTIIASDKAANRLFVYDLQGSVIQQIVAPGMPGNIDVRYGFPLTGELVDIVAFNDRTTDRIVVYEVAPATRTLARIDSNDLVSVDSYGLCLYRSPSTGSFYVFTTTKTGVIRQFELFDAGSGIAADLVRSWNLGSITEGCVADDETGCVYLAEENEGIWKTGAEPGDPTPGTTIATVGDGSGLTADVEGLAIYYAAGGGGYLLASSQGNSRFIVYDRAPPHPPLDQFTVSGVLRTDGIDVTNVYLGPAFPYGIFACHNDNSSPKRVEVCGFEDLGLAIDTDYWDPRTGVPTHVTVEESNVDSPVSAVLAGPNPVRKSTRLRFHLARTGSVSLRVVDGAGRHVATLLDARSLGAGWHSPEWDGRDVAGRPVPAGVYFVRLDTPDGTSSTKTTVVR